MKVGSFRSVLRIRNFSLLCTGNMVSQFGDRITHMALLALIGQFQPGSHLAFSKMAASFTLPVILFGPFAGIVSDRVSRKGVLLVGDIARAALIALIPLFMLLKTSMLPVYAVIFLVFTLCLFFNVARSAIIPDLVPRDRLLEANSLNSFIARFATVAGTVLGGKIIDWIGWRGGFFLDASTYVLSFFCILFIVVERPVPEAEASVAREARSVMQDLKEAVELATRNRVIALLLLTVAGFSYVSAAAYVVLIPLVQQTLGKGTGGVGIVAGVLAVGMVVGALVLGTLGKNFRKSSIILASFLLFGLFLTAARFVKDYTVITAGSFFAGMLSSFIIVAQDTLFQELVPMEKRGRIFGLKEWTASLAFLVSTLGIGMFAESTSGDTAILSLGLSVSVLSLIALIFKDRLAPPGSAQRSG
jgi:MFS family permease